MPTPEIIKDDSEAVLRYCRQDLGLKGKMGVYGRSLGGIATTHLSKFVDMIIVDRSFNNLYDVAFHKFHGFLAVVLYKIGTWGWDSSNDISYLGTEAGAQTIKAEMLAKGFCSTEEEKPLQLTEDEAKFKEKSCYKVFTCDVNDEIIILQGSLMIGIARQVALAHQKKTEHYKD